MAYDADISAEDPTPMMKVWAKDAQEFGIPYETQKGLMFITAFGLRASYQPTDLDDWIKFTRKLSKKIRLKKPHISTDDGGDFHDQNFSPLLTELAERFCGQDFSPRQVPGHSKSYTIWDREGVANQLPECLKEGMWRLSDWNNVMSALCEKIGRDIHMDLEGSYLAGFLYFDSCYPLDTRATMQMSMLVSGMLPPKFMWFRHMLNFDPDLAGQGNSMQKVLDCFLSDIAHEAPLVYRLVTYLSDQLHYEAVGVKRQSVWDASTLEFACMTAPQSEYFDFGSPEAQESLADVRRYLAGKHNFTAPAACRDLESAVQAVGDHVFGRWGCSLLDEPTDMAADRWTRRCCVLYTCVVFSILNPRWNKFS